MADPFDDPEWVLRVYHRMAEAGHEIPPGELALQLRGFFSSVQDELAKEGVWWSLNEVVRFCLQPIVLGAIKALADVRGSANLDVFVDAITSLERRNLNVDGTE